MKLHNYECRVHECMTMLFCVWSPEEPEPSVGDMVYFEGTWYTVVEVCIDDHVDYAIVRRATWWERLCGGRRGDRKNPTH